MICRFEANIVGTVAILVVLTMLSWWVSDPNAADSEATETHALLAGSPVINTGDEVSRPDADQRGITRPQVAGCDIWEFEYQP